MKKKPSWIYFESVSAPRLKTETWRVCSTADRSILGWIRWFGHWRGYSFFPEYETVFERTCLRDIANFIERENKERREMRKNIRMLKELRVKQ